MFLAQSGARGDRTGKSGKECATAWHVASSGLHCPARRAIVPAAKKKLRLTPRSGELMKFFLLAFPALFSIINPIGSAFIFLAATRSLSPPVRVKLSRWVAIHSFVLLNVSLYVGAYVLSFFGISMPVLRVAGGIIIAVSGFRMLYEGDDSEAKETALEIASERDASRLAFFPLTMPLTTGPGTISVAIALGTNRPKGIEFVWFLLAATFTTAVMALLIYFMYKYSDRISKAIGPTGSTIVVRLSAFLLFCIGIQVLWSGLAELLQAIVGTH
jgi:multiple antibiotic resistance protein